MQVHVSATQLAPRKSRPSIITCRVDLYTDTIDQRQVGRNVAFPHVMAASCTVADLMEVPLIMAYRLPPPLQHVRSRIHTDRLRRLPTLHQRHGCSGCRPCNCPVIDCYVIGCLSLLSVCGCGGARRGTVSATVRAAHYAKPAHQGRHGQHGRQDRLGATTCLSAAD